MSHEITISLISARPAAAVGSDRANTVDAVTGFWKEQLAHVLPKRPDLIVLPEVCESPCIGPGLDVCPRYDKEMLAVFSELARKHRTWLAVPTLRPSDDGKIYNSIRLLDRQGEVHGVYDKNHPTIGEIEAGIAPSDQAEVIETEFGRVAGVICFDLNFRSLLLRYAEQRPDLVLFCSMYHGGLMQSIWAYWCRAHFVGAISGVPGQILSPQGEPLGMATNYTNHLTRRINLDCCVAHFDENWEALEALQKKYGPDVEIFDPGRLGSVLITCGSDQISACGMAEEMGIELLDPYFERALAVRDRAMSQGG